MLENRQFKFRVWDKNLNRFLNSDRLYIGCNGDKFVGARGFDCHIPELYHVENEDFVIQQSTDLKDINGREIFEG